MLQQDCMCKSAIERKHVMSISICHNTNNGLGKKYYIHGGSGGREKFSLGVGLGG